ncbi:hypothetical protein U9M48_030982 [Paspalum notatum var. saurae]|uniref:Uncharacterized protein n=1 Tax=Paspalum notatum var. saurae TaxID=547442 RepID=A0AAQ3X3V2_PASNO
MERMKKLGILDLAQTVPSPSPPPPRRDAGSPWSRGALQRLGSSPRRQRLEVAQPPIGPEWVNELGHWTERCIEVTGASWDVNSMDIAVSGLGWYSLGLKGTATVSLWTFEGIGVTERDAMILHRAQFLERPGFWLPIAIANAIVAAAGAYFQAPAGGPYMLFWGMMTRHKRLFPEWLDVEEMLRIQTFHNVEGSIWAYNGHYKPSAENLSNFMNFLEEKGVDLKEVEPMHFSLANPTTNQTFLLRPPRPGH